MINAGDNLKGFEDARKRMLKSRSLNRIKLRNILADAVKGLPLGLSEPLPPHEFVEVRGDPMAFHAPFSSSPAQYDSMC